MAALSQDFRFAFRQLRRSPGFSFAVVLALALGIGATTAIFSVIEGILLRPLPYHDSERLVLAGDLLGVGKTPGITAREISVYSKNSNAFSSLGAYISAHYELSGNETPEEISANRLTASVFPLLGVEPALGRVFSAEEEAAGSPVIVISHASWVNRFHSDPHILGKTVDLDSRPYTIIGVMPKGFEFPIQTGLSSNEIWIPLSLTHEELSEQRAGFWGYHLIGRLRDNVTIQQASQDADRVAQQVMRDFPQSLSSIHIRGAAVPFKENAIAKMRPLLLTLFAAVSIVLVIACVNVAGLMLVRSIRRRREVAIRLAVGARQGAILRAAFLEGLLLSVAGGLLGLALAAIVVRTTLHLLPDSMPRLNSIAIDGRVMIFALLLALATGVTCSLAPAFAAMQVDPIENLKDASQASMGGREHNRLRSVLVILEIGVAMVLLTASVALIRSFQKMQDVQPGFQSDHVLVAGYQLPLTRYPDQTSTVLFNRAVIDGLQSKPGVIAVGITNILPSSGFSGMAAYTIEGEPIKQWKQNFALFGTTYGEFFRTMGISLQKGRSFTRNDGPDSPPVVIVNEAMARHCWPGQNPLGKRMHVGNPQNKLPWATVVGVVANTKLGSRDEPDRDQWYAPVQQPTTLYGTELSGRLSDPAGGYVTLRSALAPEQMIETLRSTISTIDPLVALQHVQPMDDVISKVEAPRRFNTSFVSFFAMGALVLTVTGIYGIVAFSVSQRAQEIAIRIALGASRGSIASLVLRSGIKLALLGCSAGVLVSIAISSVLRTFLFEVSPLDPLIFTASVAAMLLLALLASALPAVRASFTDPVAALRSH